jgi:Ser/Thr protein kinase RdoA (MazF antagonist)
MPDTPDLLQRFWGIRPADVTPLGGGMNSETWLVQHEGSTFVAKRVPMAAVDELVAGCNVASALADGGFVTGRPVPTNDGSLVLTEHGLALLEYVPGRELDGETDEEQCWIASTLAGVHAAGSPARGPGSATFAADWLTPKLQGVEAHRWLARAIDAVRAETDPLTVTWSVLHTDPSPEAFIHNDSTGVTGLIDWAGAKRGPVLYDVASVVMYLGGEDHATAFLTTYGACGPLDADELELLDAFRRFRWAVQASSFAWRLALGDLTGLADRSGNEKGLDDARRGLAGLGVNTSG